MVCFPKIHPTSDLLQQALLVIAQKYPVLGLKLCWTLFANMADYSERRITQVQQAASVCLLMQLELAITGHTAIVSLIVILHSGDRLSIVIHVVLSHSPHFEIVISTAHYF